MWRGLMLSKALEQFLTDVAWSPDLGYLVIDMPPGTGDVQMALSRMLPQAEMVVVTSSALDRWQCPTLELDPLLAVLGQLRQQVGKLVLTGFHGTVQPEAQSSHGPPSGTSPAT